MIIKDDDEDEEVEKQLQDHQKDIDIRKQQLGQDDVIIINKQQDAIPMDHHKQQDVKAFDDLINT